MIDTEMVDHEYHDWVDILETIDISVVPSRYIKRLVFKCQDGNDIHLDLSEIHLDDKSKSIEKVIDDNESIVDIKYYLDIKEIAIVISKYTRQLLDR
jgi:hypothetical protein